MISSADDDRHSLHPEQGLFLIAEVITSKIQGKKPLNN
jgi:hypothetical protein